MELALGCVYGGELSALGHGLPCQARLRHGRCTPESCRTAATRKSAALGQQLPFLDQWYEDNIVRVVSISGSLRELSSNTALLEAAERLAPLDMAIERLP